MIPRPLPKVSALRMLRADPRKTRRYKKIRNALSIWVFCVVPAFATAAYVLLPVHDEVVLQATRNAAVNATSDALAQFESQHKQRLLDDQAYINTTCNKWWFGLSHKERKLVK